MLGMPVPGTGFRRRVGGRRRLVSGRSAGAAARADLHKIGTRADPGVRGVPILADLYGTGRPRRGSDPALPMLSRAAIAAWPKAELHVHLDGSVRTSTLLDLDGRAGGRVLPGRTEAEVERFLRAVDDAGSLEGYLAWFRTTVPLMQTREALYRVARELVEDVADENVRLLEVRYCPALHTAGGLSLEAVNEAVLDGLADGGRAFDVAVALIVSAVRGRPVGEAVALADLAVAHRDRGVVAFDLAGPEAGHPAKDYVEAFARARGGGLHATVHAGESFGPASVRQAVLDLGAERVGHGVRVLEDPDLLAVVVARGIAFEICPTSNVQTRVAATFEDHAIRALADAGATVTVSTDNRLFSRTTVTDELWLAHTRCGLSEEQTRRAAVDAFRHSFMDPLVRNALALRAEAAIFSPR